MVLDPMTQRGSRADLTAHLEEMAEGWHHFAKDALSEASRQGADRLRRGAATVRVGHTVYVVDETSDTSHT